jgi:hypothetical protein
MKKTGQFQIFAFALIASGFLLYVVTDKDLISTDFSFFEKQKKSEKIEQTFSSLEKELENVSDSSKEQKQKLKSLINEVDQLDRQITAQKKILKKLVSQTSPQFVISKPKARSVTSIGNQTPVKSWGSFIESTKKMLGEDTLINFMDESGKQFLSVSTNEMYSTEDIYLRPRGIQFAHLVIRATKSMAVKSINLKVLEGDIMAQQRAQVFERFLTEISEGQVTVATQKVPAGTFDFKNKDNFEIWIPLEGKSQGT